MLYLIRGVIYPRETPEARKRASIGDFDPPAGVRCLCEFEEASGSYLEVVEAKDAAAVDRYIDKSRHLFRTIAATRVNALKYVGEACDSAYLIELKGSGVGTIEMPDSVLDALTDDGARAVVVNRRRHQELFAAVSKMLLHCDEVRVVPILEAAEVWESCKRIEETDRR